MRPNDLIIRCLTLRDGEVWVSLCLDFDLAAQGRCPCEAQERLEEQISDYVRDLAAADKQHAADLFHRRAPLKYWLIWHWLDLLERLRAMRRRGEDRARAYTTTLPLVPAAS